jgi:NADH-quinone oxidoreductase subunit K
MIGLNHVLILSLVLFILGVAGFVTRRNLLIMLMSLELMLNAANVALIGFSRFQGGLDGQVLALFVIALAAAEAAVGLAIVVAVFRLKKSVNVEDLNSLKW